MIKIALIEDDAVISQMYRMKFEADGFQVEVASDGVSGVKLAKSFKPDLILLDLGLPEQSGDQTLTEIRQDETLKATPVIILTNLSKEEAPENLTELDVHSYIVKADLTPRQVVERAKAALGLTEA